MQKKFTYKQSGVDINNTTRLVKYISNLSNKTKIKGSSIKNFKNIGDKLADNLPIEYSKNNEISIKYDKTIVNIEDIIFKIKEKGLEIQDIMTEDADLEDVFLKLTNEQ